MCSATTAYTQTNQCHTFVLTLCINFLFCDDSTEVSLVDSELEKSQNNISESVASWSEHDEDWKSDRVWQNMLAVAVQVLCVPCLS